MVTRSSKAGAPGAVEALTAADVPVTRAMLGSVRTEILERIDQARKEAKADNAELKGDIQHVKGDIQHVKGDIQQVKGNIQQLDAKIEGVKAEMHEMKASMARIELLVEEQNARNKIVLDGLTAVLARQDRTEQRITAVEETVHGLATGQRSR